MGQVVGDVLRRPRLWPVAVRQGLRLAPSGWWRRWPPIPRPPADYRRFRVVTASGGEGTTPLEGAEVVQYLDWCRRFPSRTSPGRAARR
jgi:hypothetical protein